MRKSRRSARVPNFDELNELLVQKRGRLSARSLAKELGLQGGAKSELKRRIEILKGGRHQNKTFNQAQIVEIDDDGEIWAESDDWPGALILVQSKDNKSAPSLNDYLLLNVFRHEDGTLVGEVFKVLEKLASEITGVIVNEGNNNLILRPSIREKRSHYLIAQSDDDLQDGDLVRARVLRASTLGAPAVRIVEVLGRQDDPKAIPMMVAAELGLGLEFPKEVQEEANKARLGNLQQRTDLRQLQLITIDGADAKDFDDAVFAQKDPSKDNPGGYQAIVAIADVAHYVKPGSALDKEAAKRGNSVYLPGFVLPMLPHELSSGLCSLKPGEDRACVACFLTIASDGAILASRFERAMMRSHARLTYDEVQNELNRAESTPGPYQEILEPLHGVFRCLLSARQKRGTLELDIAERVIELDEKGQVSDIKKRIRYDSHMLIEELMIAANVAAASTLTERKKPCVFRLHAKPDSLKTEELGNVLKSMDLGWSKAPVRPGEFTAILNKIEDPVLRDQISTLMLRSQSQAYYGLENIGHFGLGLKNYAHFTSPIRRYADLLLHRIIIKELIDPDERTEEAEVLEERCRTISATERKAVEAERRAYGRYLARYMTSHIGARFQATITSCHSFGLFITLAENGAEGLVPVSSLGEEPFFMAHGIQALVGKRSGKAFAVFDAVEVELMEVDGVLGRLLFQIRAHKQSLLGKKAARQVLKNERRSVGRKRTKRSFNKGKRA